MPDNAGTERWTEEDAESLRVAIGRFVRAGRAFDLLPRPQAAVLGWLDREREAGPRTIADLAGLAGVRHQSMRETVGAMETEGLITTAPDPSDRRKVRCAISDAGQARLDADRRARTEWIRDRIDRRMTPAQRTRAREIAGLLDLLSAPDAD